MLASAVPNLFIKVSFQQFAESLRAAVFYGYARGSRKPRGRHNKGPFANDDVFKEIGGQIGFAFLDRDRIYSNALGLFATCM